MVLINILAFHIIFHSLMYMIPMKLKFLAKFYFHIHCYGTPKIEVNEMYGHLEEMDP